MFFLCFVYESYCSTNLRGAEKAAKQQSSSTNSSTTYPGAVDVLQQKTVKLIARTSSYEVPLLRSTEFQRSSLVI